MSLIIDLTPSEETQLSYAAQQIGLAPEELVKKLVKEHLPAVASPDTGNLDAKLREWQAMDSTQLLPDIPTRTLFAQWAEEDAQMTEEEREAEDRLWEDLERSLTDKTGRDSVF